MERKAKADFNYRTTEKHGIKFLLIEDTDCGGRSVTNDIENVVEDIKAETDITDHVIIYMDSDGNWDGWSPTKGFYPVGGQNDEEAMDRYARQFI
jgi:hypothetical protein